MRGKIKYIIIAAALVAALMFMPLFESISFVIGRELLPKKYLTVWHVDTFEGGENSRKGFLSEVGIKYQKENKNVYVIVKDMSVEGFLDGIKKSDLPDLFSFGSGVAEEVLPYLVAYQGKNNVKEEFLDAGTHNGEVKAVPWAFNGYYLFGEEKKLVYGMSKYSAPLVSLYLGGGYAELDTYFIDNYNFTTEHAFRESVNGKMTLLGTNRDVVRMGNYMDRGIVGEVAIRPQTAWVDLVSAIGICEKSGNYEESVKFIEYLLSEKIQRGLTKLKLFSPAYDIYDGGVMFEYERGEGERKVGNVFLGKNMFERLSEICIELLKGEEKSKGEFLKIVDGRGR